jgi:uncharacterized membrane protein (DUF106 family)
MDIINGAIDGLLKLYFAAFSWAPPLAGLAVLSAVIGAAMLWVFKKTSDQKRMKLVKRRVYASLLELRVFADEPAVSWRAQKSLFAANFRYMGLALKPALYMAAPMVLLILHLESFYARAPLPVGQEAIVTMAMAPGWDARAAAPAVTAPAGVEIAGPPVRVEAAREISWRIVPRSAVSGQLVFRVGGSEVARGIEAGPGQRYVAGKNVRSVMGSVWDPAQPRVASDAVEWIDVGYPDATISAFGVRLSWLVWFFGISVVAALVLKKRFGVVI